MNTQIASHRYRHKRAPEHTYPIHSEPIRKIHRPEHEFKLLESAAAFLSRMGG